MAFRRWRGGHTWPLDGGRRWGARAGAGATGPGDGIPALSAGSGPRSAVRRRQDRRVDDGIHLDGAVDVWERLAGGRVTDLVHHGRAEP